MLFSIIIPIYNKERYLERCLNSVCKQSFHDFECLLIDDGSTDGCPSICKKYAQQYPYMTVHHKENGGLSDARNVGISKAKGEYLLFLDADDCIDENLLQICSQVICESKPDIVTFGIVPSYATDNNIINTSDAVAKINSQNNLIYNILQNNTEWSVCNKVFKKSIFKEIQFPKGRLFEDQFVIIKLLNDKKVVRLHNNLYYYFQDVTDSLSKRKVYKETYDYLLAAFEVIKDLETYKKEQCLACELAYKRAVLLLTNAFYKEGQFQNCKIEKIDAILKENASLLYKGLKGKKLSIFWIYLHVPRIFRVGIIRMRFQPVQYIRYKIRNWRGNHNGK